VKSLKTRPYDAEFSVTVLSRCIRVIIMHLTTQLCTQSHKTATFLSLTHFSISLSFITVH